MAKEIQYFKFVKLVCTLEPGDIVIVKGFGKELEGKDWEIEEVIANRRGCQSGFQVKLKGYPRPLDSDWVDKKHQQKLKM